MLDHNIKKMQESRGEESTTEECRLVAKSSLFRNQALKICLATHIIYVVHEDKLMSNSLFLHLSISKRLKYWQQREALAPSTNYEQFK